MPDRPAPRHRQRSPGWWIRPTRRRSCRTRLARTIGLPIAAAFCVLALALVIVPAMIA